MKSCCIYYWDNGVGVKIDAQLIKDCLSKDFLCKVFDFSFIENDFDNFFNTNIGDNFDIGIFIQNYDLNLLENNKINIYICNEEWLGNESLADLKYFDHIIVKSEFAKKQIQHLHKSIKCLYFWSRDLYNNSNIVNDKILHFAGKSIQKNTECLLNNDDIIIFDSNARFKDVRYINYHTNYVSINKLEHIFNLCSTHVCPSLYEAHGHYMFEGMLCDKKIIASKIPVWEEQIDPDYLIFLDTKPSIIINEEYEFLNSNKDSESIKFPFRRGFIIDSSDLEEKIYSKKYKKPRKYLIDLFNSNKNNFLEFFKNI